MYCYRSNSRRCSDGGVRVRVGVKVRVTTASAMLQNLIGHAIRYNSGLIYPEKWSLYIIAIDDDHH